MGIYCNISIFTYSQILKNIKRGSVEGLSPIMFFCAVMGNLTYAGGILIRARNEAAVIKALPYLVGSIGTLCFDLRYCCNFYITKIKYHVGQNV